MKVKLLVNVMSNLAYVGCIMLMVFAMYHSLLTAPNPVTLSQKDSAFALSGFFFSGILFKYLADHLFSAFAGSDPTRKASQ